MLYRFTASYFSKSTFLYIILIFLASKSTAQTQVFTPVPQDSLQLESLKPIFEKVYQQEIANLPTGNRNDLTKLYKDRWDNVKEKFDKKEIYISQAAQQYLDKLLEEIIKANPILLQTSIHCYFSRSGIPNASYIGVGIILFNMGLFDKLENESQAVFVLCHELSHLLLKHGENSIQKYVTTLNSDLVQKQLHKIKDREFGKREELDNLLKGLTFDTRKHGRDHESEADSMAIELMRHTKYNLSASLTALGQLDSIDNDPFKTSISLPNLFNSAAYPFRKKWLAREEGLLGGHATLKKDQALNDSLKTHPDCQARIKLLEPLVNLYHSTRDQNSGTNPQFNVLQNLFKYEVIEYAFQRGNYAKSLQYSLGVMINNISDPYLITQVGKIFNEFYLADKAHTLGRVTELPSPYMDPNYNLLLQFIQNLYREDFASIGYYFLEPFQKQLAFYKPYNTALSLASKYIKQL